MGYEVALNKAWEDLANLNAGNALSIKFLADTYQLDLREKKALSLSCNVAAKDFTAILILHYAAQKLKGLPDVRGEWLSFKEVSQVEGYLPAFKKRAISPLLRKYGSKPEGIITAAQRIPLKRVDQGDVGIVLEAFEKVPVLITLWRGDDEFGPEANMLFDKNITRIFCAEDIVVLAGIIAASV
ncbi:MAG: DUF3786 domain-containing protein [Candidatus Omnitrophica bacterium]|nr:DUF3786 domain-containing protein [Candidatus Omnitrophota bacterium]